MEAFQIVYDENLEHEIEILSDQGVNLLLQCYKDDFANYMELYDSKSPTSKPYWDWKNHLNWDYMLSGINELTYYLDFMGELAQEVGDVQAAINFDIANELLGEVEQEVSDVLMYTAGNSAILVQKIDTYRYWSELFYNIVYIEQTILETMSSMGGGK